MEIDSYDGVSTQQMDPARRAMYAKLGTQFKESGFGQDDMESFISTMRHTMKNDKYDDCYMQCLINPEGSDGSRIPTPFGRQSALVKQQSTLFLNTGGSGEAMFAYMPQDLHSFGLVQVVQAIGSQAIPQETGLEQFYPLHFINSMNTVTLSTNFQAARVVGASIRITYTGDLENETGYLVGGHIYDQQLGMLDVERINESYGTINCRPHDGLRMTYLPRGEIDFDYTPLDQRVTPNVSIVGLNAPDGSPLGYSLTPTMYCRTTDTTFDTPVEKPFVLQQRGITGLGITATQATWVGPVQPTATTGPITDFSRNFMDFVGTGPRSSIPANPYPQMLAFYFKGLPTAKTWFKIDIVRHLECIPRFILKEVVSVQRPLSDQISQNIARQIGMAQKAIAASTMADAPKILEAATRLSQEAPDGTSFIKALTNILDVSSYGDGMFAKWAKFATMPGRVAARAILGPDDKANAATLVKAIMPIAENAGSAAVKALVGIAKNEFGDSNVSSMIDTFKSRFG